jgi:hypothetical protein
MIPGVCPDCGAARPLPDYLADAEARAALAEALRLLDAELGRLVVHYLALHAPAGRRIRLSKLRRLIGEVGELLRAGTVTRGGETLPAPLPAWRAGIEQVLANRDAGTLSLPLEGHGYLTEIVHRQQRTAGQRSARETRPTHASQRPFPPEPDAAAAPADGAEAKARALSDYRSTQRLLGSASGVTRAALKAQLSAQAGRLRALGVQLPAPAPDPTQD